MPPITIEYKHRVCIFNRRGYSAGVEDAYSIQLTLRQVTELIMCAEWIPIEPGSFSTRSRCLFESQAYELEKPQPEQVVTDPEALNRESASETPSN